MRNRSGHDSDGEESSVGRVSDGDGSDGDSSLREKGSKGKGKTRRKVSSSVSSHLSNGEDRITHRHLNNRVQRIDSIQHAALHWHSDHRKSSHSRNHPGQMSCSSGSSDDTPQPPSSRLPRVPNHPIRSPVCRNDRQLVRNVELGEDLSSSGHGRQIRIASHDDSNERGPGADSGFGRGSGRSVLGGKRGEGREGREEDGSNFGEEFRVRIGGDGDVPHLPSSPAFGLSIEVDGSSGDEKSSGYALVDGVEGGGLADEVDGRGGGDSKGGGSEREGGDGSEVVLELGGVAGFDGVVTRIVRTRSDFVDEEGV